MSLLEKLVTIFMLIDGILGVLIAFTILIFQCKREDK